MFENDSRVTTPFDSARPVEAALDLSTPVRQAVAVIRPDVEALAAAVKRRRGELRLAQGDLKARGGPGVVTVGQIERAAIAAPQERTLAGLNEALDWAPETAQRILAGDKNPPVRLPARRGPEPGTLGPFRLPAEADRLSQKQRAAVVAVVRAMLEPAEEGSADQPAAVTTLQPRARRASERDEDLAARTVAGGSRGIAARRAQDEEAERPDEPGPEDGL